MDFIKDNWMLILAFFLSGGYLLLSFLRKTDRSMITPVEAVGKINREKAIIVDLRESETYDAGHLVGARNLPASKIKEDGIKGLPKNKAFPVILVCASGVTARKYAKTFRDEGYENVFVLDGGIGGWVKAEFPIERKDGVVV